MNVFMSQMVDRAKLTHILAPMIGDLEGLYQTFKERKLNLSEADAQGVAGACNNRIAQVFATLSDKRFEENYNDFLVVADIGDENIVLKPSSKLAKVLNQCGIRNFGYIFKKEQE